MWTATLLGFSVPTVVEASSGVNTMWLRWLRVVQEAAGRSSYHAAGTGKASHWPNTVTVDTALPVPAQVTQGNMIDSGSATPIWEKELSLDPRPRIIIFYLMTCALKPAKVS